MALPFFDFFMPRHPSSGSKAFCAVYLQYTKIHTMETPAKKHSSLKDYFAVSEVFTYFFRKKSDTKPSLSLRMMHGVNKISIIIFLLAVLVLIARRLAD